MVLGGVMPLLLAVVLIVALPESARFMVVRGYPAQRIAAVLKRIAPLNLAEPLHFSLSENGQVKNKSALG